MKVAGCEQICIHCVYRANYVRQCL